ncbi:MAG: hypothetical protein R3C05_02535 [Pirellulaceae bacterium]
MQAELPEMASLPQDTSFRSSPVITDNVTRVFTNLGKHPAYSSRVDHPVTDDEWKSEAIHSFVAGFNKHSANFTDRPGYFQFSAGPKCEGATAEKNAAHQRYVARQVKNLAERIPGKSIGILTRTNQAVGRMIYLLRELELDVSQEGGNPLVDSAAVELVLSTIRMAEHPGDLRLAVSSRLFTVVRQSEFDNGNRSIERIRRKPASRAKLA